MSRPRDFNEFWGDQLARNRRAGEILFEMHLEKPFQCREDIRLAYRQELERIEANAFSVDDECVLRQMNITL